MMITYKWLFGSLVNQGFLLLTHVSQEKKYNEKQSLSRECNMHGRPIPSTFTLSDVFSSPIMTILSAIKRFQLTL